MKEARRIKGFKWIRWSIIISLILVPLSMSSNLLLRYLKANHYSDNKLFIYVFGVLLLLFLFGLFGKIMLGSGLISIKRSDWGRSPKQERNMKRALMFFWLNIIMMIVVTSLKMIFRFRIIEDISRFDYLQAFVISPMEMILSISFFLAITLPIWRLCNRRSRDLVLIYFILFIIIPLILEPILIGMYILELQSIIINVTGISFSIILLASSIMSNVIMLIVYTKIIKMIEGDEKKDEEPIIKGWDRVKKRFSLMMRKPIPVILVIVVIGIIIGSSSEYAYQFHHENVVEDNDFSDFERSTETENGVELYDTNYLKESTREVYEIDPDRSIRSVEVHLSWQDEEPDELDLNEPDNFTLKLDLANSTGFYSMEQEGVNGSLYILYQIEDETDRSLGYLEVTVDMNRAGDILDFFGITTRSQDDGNEYDLRVNIEYFDDR